MDNAFSSQKYNNKIEMRRSNKTNDEFTYTHPTARILCAYSNENRKKKKKKLNIIEQHEKRH